MSVSVVLEDVGFLFSPPQEAPRHCLHSLQVSGGQGCGVNPAIPPLPPARSFKPWAGGSHRKLEEIPLPTYVIQKTHIKVCIPLGGGLPVG